MSVPTRLIASSLSRLPLRLGRSASSTTRLAPKDGAWTQIKLLGSYYESIVLDPTQYPFEQKPELPPDSADPDVLPYEKKPKPASEEKPKPTAEIEPGTSPEPESEKTPKSPPIQRKPKKKPGRKPKADASGPAVAPTPAASTLSATTAEKARIIFGSRLLGPAEQADRLAIKRAQSTYIAGVLVPPQPEEPDNCCMSGCVNCVWERYQEDMEEWLAKKNAAKARLNEMGGSVDADGGGSQLNWDVTLSGAKITKDFWDEEAFASVPVGIREFMKQEKRLRDKHRRGDNRGLIGAIRCKSCIITGPMMVMVVDAV